VKKAIIKDELFYSEKDIECYDNDLNLQNKTLCGHLCIIINPAGL
jgi:hypothetical protein